MGLFKKVKKGFKKVSKSSVGKLAHTSAGTYFGGPAGGAFATALTASKPKPSMASVPTSFFPRSQPFTMPTTQPYTMQTMAARPLIGATGVGKAVAEFVGPILAKMSAALGKNITLRAAIIIIRRLGKFLDSPTLIAGAVGIAVSELGQLLVGAQLAGVKGRRMNVGNIKALKRAHRRVEGFHRICKTNDELRKPARRRSPAPRSIQVCR